MGLWHSELFIVIKCQQTQLGIKVWFSKLGNNPTENIKNGVNNKKEKWKEKKGRKPCNHVGHFFLIFLSHKKCLHTISICFPILRFGDNFWTYLPAVSKSTNQERRLTFIGF